jgi:hypothetical protein
VSFVSSGCVEKANSAAHCCASMVSVTHRSYFWLDYFPEWLVGLAALIVILS